VYTYAARVWDSSIIQGPFSVAPCLPRHDSQLFHRCTQVTQRASVYAFGTVHKRAWGLGLAGSLGAYIMSFYYSVVMAWCVAIPLSTIVSRARATRTPRPFGICPSLKGHFLSCDSHFFSNAVRPRRALHAGLRTLLDGGRQAHEVHVVHEVHEVHVARCRAWCFLFRSFEPRLPWAGGIKQAEHFFYHDTLGSCFPPSGCSLGAHPTRIYGGISRNQLRSKTQCSNGFETPVQSPVLNTNVATWQQVPAVPLASCRSWSSRWR
jgi:hypothetical protein